MEILLNFDLYSLQAIILLGFSALILLISYDWRLIISALGLMYAGIFILVSVSWTLEMAVIKIIAGWISASVLGISIFNENIRNHNQIRYSYSEIIFRISAAGLVGLVAISISPGVLELIREASNEQVVGGVILIGMGLLHLGLSNQPLNTIIGLLIFFGGFEILYSTIDSSILMNGFIAIINLSLALVGAYLLLSPTMESD
jgi:hypothetical protein